MEPTSQEVAAWETGDYPSQSEDPYADVPPPASTDGPQEPVDESELEDETHPDAS